MLKKASNLSRAADTVTTTYALDSHVAMPCFVHANIVLFSANQCLCLLLLYCRGIYGNMSPEANGPIFWSFFFSVDENTLP